MPQPHSPPTRRISPASYIRPLAIVATWLSLVGLATAVFFAPRGTEAQPSANDVVDFALSLAIAGAVTVIAAFAVGGRWRWALEVASSAILTSLLVALVVGYLFWFDPRLARSRLGYSDYAKWEWLAHAWAVQVPAFLVPLAAALGIPLGSVVGLLARLVRRMPRMAAAIAVLLLVASASDPVRQFASVLLTPLGWIVRTHFVPWSISGDQITETGMLFGAISGAVIAGLSMHLARDPRN